MAQVPEHPLLSLPDDQIIQKLRKMSMIEILKFSLLSERCRELVASIQIEGSSFHVSIWRNITIFIKARIEEIEISFYTEPDMYWGNGEHGQKKKLTVPQSVKVYEYNFIYPDYTETTWENNTLTMQYWLNHLQYIFNYPKIDRIWFSDDSFQFDIADIKEVFGKTIKVKIGSTGCFAFNQMIVQKFSSLEKLSIKASSFPNSKVPESTLIQNFDELHVGGIMEITSMTLDELLLINSKTVIVENHQMPKKLLNNFIKLWQKGSNPHMEFLCTFYLNAEEDDREIVMRGIKHEVVPDNRKRMFKSVGLTDTSPVTGGIDIYRMDGTKATIQINNGLMFFIVRMYVWFDHCVVES
ncbi:unnamed protein product [Caenorhabditis brenneri]